MTLDQIMPFIKAQLESGQCVKIYPNGISMRPMIHQGRDSVELSPLPEGRLKKHDLPLYQRDDGHYVLHRIIKVGEHYTCVGDNQFTWEYPVRDDQLIAVVTAFTRNGRYIKTTNFWYRLYYHFWYVTRPVRHICRWLKGRLKRLFK